MPYQFSRELRVTADASNIAMQLHQGVYAAKMINMSRRGILCSDVGAVVGETLRFELNHRGRTIYGTGEVRWRGASQCGVRIQDFLGYGEVEWLKLMGSSLAQLPIKKIPTEAPPVAGEAGDFIIPQETPLADALKMFAQARSDVAWVPQGEQWTALRTADVLPYWMEMQELNAITDRQRLRDAVTVLAHDLATPIGIVRTTNSLLLSGIASPESFIQEGYAAMVDDNCQRALDFIDDMIAVSCDPLGEMRLTRTTCDLVEMVQEIEKLFQSKAQLYSIQLSSESQVASASVAVDRSKIERALQNLVSNALKYSASSAQVCIRLRRDDDQWCVEVQDTGVGISPKDLPHVFDAFSRVKNTPLHGERSHGLGLSIAKGIVEAHGGTLQVQSELGVGSTFRILLPAS